MTLVEIISNWWKKSKWAVAKKADMDRNAGERSGDFHFTNNNLFGYVDLSFRYHYLVEVVRFHRTTSTIYSWVIFKLIGS